MVCLSVHTVSMPYLCIIVIFSVLIRKTEFLRSEKSQCWTNKTWRFGSSNSQIPLMWIHFGVCTSFSPFRPHWPTFFCLFIFLSHIFFSLRNEEHLLKSWLSIYSDWQHLCCFPMSHKIQRCQVMPINLEFGGRPSKIKTIQYHCAPCFVVVFSHLLWYPNFTGLKHD